MINSRYILLDRKYMICGLSHNINKSKKIISSMINCDRVNFINPTLYKDKYVIDRLSRASMGMYVSFVAILLLGISRTIHRQYIINA